MHKSGRIEVIKNSFPCQIRFSLKDIGREGYKEAQSQTFLRLSPFKNYRKSLGRICIIFQEDERLSARKKPEPDLFSFLPPKAPLLS